MRAAESQSRAFRESTSCCSTEMRRSRSSAAAIADCECHLVCRHTRACVMAQAAGDKVGHCVRLCCRLREC